MALQRLNPNQFALPGMEHLSHPGADLLPQGYSFKYEHEMTADEEVHHVETFKTMQHSYWSDTFKETRHYEADERVGHLYWAGALDHDSRYPGEIKFVSVDEGHRGKGIPDAMFKMGHEVDLGHDTVPVHSPIRTDDGERFYQRVKGPGPENNGGFEFDYAPPHGTHPFEQAKIAEDDKTQRTRMDHFNLHKQHGGGLFGGRDVP